MRRSVFALALPLSIAGIAAGVSACGPAGDAAPGDGGSGSGSGSGGATGSLFHDASLGDGSHVCPTPSPANYDFPGDGCDDDGDGQTDNAPVCDKGLSVGGTAHDFANAIGICQDATDTKWGIVSATFTKGYMGGAPNDAQHGILPGFGSVIVPREGSSLGVLSSGYARDYDDAAGMFLDDCASPTSQTQASCFKGYQAAMSGESTPPPGYPKAAAACPNQTGFAVYDAIALRLQVRVPANAWGFAFDFDFYSSEWPEYVCTPFNDGFVAWLQSVAFVGAGNGDLNVSFDAKGNPVSTNNAFFDRCTTNASTGCCAGKGSGPEGCGAPTATSACAGGPAELEGTGFQDDGTYCGGPSTGGGATGWLTTTAPVNPGEVITLQFVIWDTGDTNWDSTVLVDHFQWQAGTTTNGTTRPSQ